MKKKIIVGCIILLVILILGATVSLYGKFYFTTEYYQTAEKAIENVSIPASIGAFEIEKTVDVTAITDSTYIYIGLTNDKELYAGELFVKGGRFSSPGNFVLYANQPSENAETENIEDMVDRFPIYNSKGIKTGWVYFTVIFDSVQNYSVPEDANVLHYSDIEGIGEFDFVYYVR